MIVAGGLPVNFNYVAYDQATGLRVAGLIYNVTTGSPILFGSAIGMTDEGGGVYAGSFTPIMGQSYLVITSVYQDSGFTIPDTSRGPNANQYDAFEFNSTPLNFNYGAYDQDPSLTIVATILDLTSNTTSTQNMVYVTQGVYFGHYVGTLNHSYLVTKQPTVASRSPGADSFQCYTISELGPICTIGLTGRFLTNEIFGLIFDNC